MQPGIALAVAAIGFAPCTAAADLAPGVYRCTTDHIAAVQRVDGRWHARGFGPSGPFAAFVLRISLFGDLPGEVRQHIAYEFSYRFKVSDDSWIAEMSPSLLGDSETMIDTEFASPGDLPAGYERHRGYGPYYGRVGTSLMLTTHGDFTATAYSPVMSYVVHGTCNSLQ